MYIPLITGSVAEFYIQPMFSCVGDVDVMLHRSNELAIPAGTAPPTQLPAEFHRHVTVYEIIDSEFQGYVYLVSSYLLTEFIGDGKYNAVQYEREYETYDSDAAAAGGVKIHGPAVASYLLGNQQNFELVFPGSTNSMDIVPCVHCLSWPLQAADWPSRHREYGWPDSATVERVVSNGCDVVPVAHHQCKHCLLYTSPSPRDS